MTTTTRSRIGAAALVAGALLFSLGDVLRRAVEPAGAASAAATTAAVASHQAAWTAAASLQVLSAFFLVAGACTAFGSTRGRGARTTDIGACLVGAGAIASVGHAVAFYTPYSLFARAGTPEAALTAIDDASERLPVLALLVLTFMVGLMVGTLVLAVGTWRARRAPAWVLVPAVAFVAAGATSGTAAGLVGLVAAVVTFGLVARAIVREPAERLDPAAVPA
jgi:hypothetical protein